MSEHERSYHHGHLRIAVLEHAEAMLEESGVESLSLREVARRAGVSNAAPRRHFPDKRALLTALAERGYEQLEGEINAVLATAPDGFTERLTAFAQAYVEFGARHPSLLELMMGAKYWPDAEHLRVANHRAFAGPIALLEQAAAAGEIDGDDPERVNTAVLAVLQGLVVLATSGLAGPRPIGESVASTISTLVNGLGRRERPVA